MIGESICTFIPSRNLSRDLLTLNFVFERMYFRDAPHSEQTYLLAIAATGVGVLHTATGEALLQPGDLFFILPGHPYYVENMQDFSYIYITYLGTRANALSERLRLSERPPVVRGQRCLLPFWETAVTTAQTESADLSAEGVLLFTMSFLCNTTIEAETADADIDIVLRIKNYVEEHFSDTELSLNTVAESFGYSAKYISSKFAKTVRIGFVEYLHSLRLERARHMLVGGAGSVSEIASRCGYADPRYFSRLFRERFGVSPIAYRKANTPPV